MGIRRPSSTFRLQKTKTSDFSRSRRCFRVNPRSLIEAVHTGDKIEFAVDGKKYTIKKILVVTHGE